ncbi:MAG: hypothetical protein DSY47_06950 [Hydrogenothermus sp.]|nr:MAG: hypothetical protein DSY47_06950 [Hydrogenothermus sp.]
MSKDKIMILSSGDILVEKGIISIESKLLEMLDQTEHDLYIMMYTVSSKPDNFWTKLEELLMKKIGVHFTLESSVKHSNKAIEILKKLDRYDNFNLYFHSGDSPLHAKLIVSDGKRAILGSANISGGGLVQNHEIAVYIEGDKAWTLKNIAKRLIKNL